MDEGPRAPTALVWLGDRVDLDLEPQCLRDLHDRREARVAVGRERCVEAFATHPDPSGEFAHVARARDGAENLRDEGRVVAGFLQGGLKVGATSLSVLRLSAESYGENSVLAMVSPLFRTSVGLLDVFVLGGLRDGRRSASRARRAR